VEAKVYILEMKATQKVAYIPDKGEILWPDRSSIEDGRVRYAIVLKEGNEISEAERHYLGKKKEDFDIEVYAIDRGL
jgi:hypothetical protein